jgi:hypothetical protein
MRIRAAVVFCLAVVSALPVVAQTPARGTAINLPLLGRLTGNGNVLYRTAIDVSNHTTVPVRVDFYLDGQDLATGAPVVVDGSINAGGSIGAWGIGSPMRARSNAHFDDFVDAVIAAGLLPATLRANGFLGSVLFIFDNRSESGETAVTARFYNALGDGTVGVSLKGREITRNEPQSLVAAVSDTRGNTTGAPRAYPNLFINNTGVAAGNSMAVAGPVTVEVSAVANTTGLAVGTPLTISDLQPGRTVAVSQVLNALQIPAGAESTVLLFVRVTSGNAAIQGIVSQIDDVTRDGSVFEMSRADFRP